MLSRGLFALSKRVAPRSPSRAISSVCNELVTVLEKERIVWKPTNDPVHPSETTINGQHLKLKVKDFPDEELYAVVHVQDTVEKEILSTNECPSNWDFSEFARTFLASGL